MNKKILFFKLINLFDRGIKWIGRKAIAFSTPIINNRITLIIESHSGSNTRALYVLMNKEFKTKFDVILYQDGPISGIISFFRKYRLLASSKVIVTTHASYKLSRNQFHVQLWHGAFIKKNGWMVTSQQQKFFKTAIDWLRVDYILSYSETYTTYMNACMVTDPRKYIVTGAPRNDFLFKSSGSFYLKKIFPLMPSCNSVILFAPTFKEDNSLNYRNEINDNIFQIDNWNSSEFIKFLEENNLVLVVKPHPHEEKELFEIIKSTRSNRILLLTNDILKSLDIDLYEVLNSIDLLITDYSSLYYDYLLLDRPILFVNPNNDIYQEDRGFLIEDLKNYFPGPVVGRQYSMINEILKLLSLNDYYKNERTSAKKVMHRFQDAKSTERMCDLIFNLATYKKPSFSYNKTNLQK